MGNLARRQSRRFRLRLRHVRWLRSGASRYHLDEAQVAFRRRGAGQQEAVGLSRFGELKPMSRQFEGKVALITGGSSGIGRATALAFAAEGARVAIGARRSAEGEETVGLIKQQGGEALFVLTDVSVPEQVQALVESTVERWGRLDCAVNNAGIEGTPFVPVTDYSVDVWDQVIDVNLKGVFLSMKYEVPHLLRSMSCATEPVAAGPSEVPAQSEGRSGPAPLVKQPGSAI